MACEATRLLGAIGLLAAFAGVPALAQQTTPPAQSSAQDPNAFVKEWDQGGKGMLDLHAVTDAAIVKFERLDTDHKGRLTAQQLSSVLSPQDFAAANPDNDKTIGALEWLNLVTRDFYAAIPDHTDAITVEDLQSTDGQRLLRLIE